MLLGGLAAGVIGTWITYRATDAQFEQRLLLRIDTLGRAINHAAMATSDWSVVQHMIGEVVKGEPDLKIIIVASKSPPRIVASTMPKSSGLAVDNLPDEHLRRELLDTLKTGNFGSHFESQQNHAHAGDLIVIVPLEPAMAHHGGHSSHKMSGHEMSSRPAPSSDTHDHGAMKNDDAVVATGSRMQTSRYRGAILIQVSQSAIHRGSSYVLWQYLLALLASIIVILLIAYVAIEHQVLRPLRFIHTVITRRKSGDNEARVSLLQHDEIGAVAQTLNETLDNEDEQGKQLSQAVVTAETANVAKSAFLANMSHELRTPLNAIIGFSDIMRLEALGPVGSPRYREYSNDINQAGQHLLYLINDILDISKIEAEKDELYEENLDIHKVVESAVTLVRQQAEKNSIDLKQEIEKDLPLLSADDRKLKQILINLLTNAVKFTKPGGSVAINVWCRPENGFVFQIVDTGIGITPNDIPKAMALFGQVDGDLNRKYNGTGLGLPLTKALVELHGGTLDIQSEVGTGTTVSVRIPGWRNVSKKANVA